MGYSACRKFNIGTKMVTSNLLKDFGRSKGIELKYTMPYQKKETGSSGRMKETLLDNVRAKFVCKETNPWLELWGGTIQCSAYEMDRSPTEANSGETPASKSSMGCYVPVIEWLLCSWLFQISYNNGRFSDSWKTAWRQPVAKKCPKSLRSNYGPMSIIPVVSMLVVKVINRSILK